MGKKKAARKAPRVGQEELSILQFIQRRHPISVRDVADHFASAGKARTTILTVMERLRSKGLLTRIQDAGAWRYSPVMDSGDLNRSLVGDFIQRVLGGSLSPLMAYMSDADDISDEELEELREVVRELDRQRTSKK